MNMMTLNLKAETVTQPVFIFQNVPYYPHHADRHRWVGPGRMSERKAYSTSELVDANARLTTMQLWKRSWTSEVKGWKML